MFNGACKFDVLVVSDFLQPNSPGRTFLWCPSRPGDLLPFLPPSLFFLSSFFLSIHLLRLSHHESQGVDFLRVYRPYLRQPTF